MLGQQNESGIEQVHNVAMNVVEGICSIVCRPVELILRPRHGTRYFPVPVVFLSTMLVLFMPVVSEMAGTLTRFIPGAAPSPPAGIFGIWSFAKLYFVLSLFTACAYGG